MYFKEVVYFAYANDAIKYKFSREKSYSTILDDIAVDWHALKLTQKFIEILAL